MPYRQIPLVAGEIYHVLNRSIARQPMFLSKRDYQRALNCLQYYIYLKPPLRYSHFRRLPHEQRLNMWENLTKAGKKQVKILAFCLMPNHLHLLIEEIIDGGITSFMRYFQDSYAKYFNLKTDRTGSLFQSPFKSVRVESDEQLVHLTRYIHLNPFSAFILKSIEEIESYQWSSFRAYLSNQTTIVDTTKVLRYFPTVKQFKDSTLDQADYQRKLEQIKHLALE